MRGISSVHVYRGGTLGVTYYEETCQSKHVICRSFAQTAFAPSRIGRSATCVRRTILDRRIESTLDCADR